MKSVVDSYIVSWGIYNLAVQVTYIKMANKSAVMNQWNGMVEWNTGMEYWNGSINATKTWFT